MQPAHRIILSPRRFEALVLDLDGVVTRTARVHAAAWKDVFDAFLRTHAAAASATEDPAFRPFDIATDYFEHVDGKPRYVGVRDFLESRGIELPYGDTADPPERDSVCGLGNRKNDRFLARLTADAVEVYDSTVEVIRAARAAGLCTAIVSSSRNCRAVLDAAGLADLFDARVDGLDLERSNLPGKPAPDMFAEALRRLGVTPARAIAVEDSSAGVRAARAAGYGCVIGVDRDHHASSLSNSGAHVVVRDLAEVAVTRDGDAMDERVTDWTGSGNRKRMAGELPIATERIAEILPGPSHRIALFLDYDGTLTPIVNNPEDALLSESMRTVVRGLASRCAVAIISGRDLPDVRERVAISAIWYAGSHGFDIAGPGGEEAQHQDSLAHLSTLDSAEARLRRALEDVPGALVERKRFAIAIHYRNVPAARVADVEAAARQADAVYPDLRMRAGKKIYELLPDVDWDKGATLHWLMRTLELDPDRVKPIYIGDDSTDEDAFREAARHGVGIVVAEPERETLATYRLPDTNAVQHFLEDLLAHLDTEPEP